MAMAVTETEIALRIVRLPLVPPLAPSPPTSLVALCPLPICPLALSPSRRQSDWQRMARQSRKPLYPPAGDQRVGRQLRGVADLPVPEDEGDNFRNGPSVTRT